MLLGPQQGRGLSYPRWYLPLRRDTQQDHHCQSIMHPTCRNGIEILREHEKADKIAPCSVSPSHLSTLVEPSSPFETQVSCLQHSICYDSVKCLGFIMQNPLSLACCKMHLSWTDRFPLHLQSIHLTWYRKALVPTAPTADLCLIAAYFVSKHEARPFNELSVTQVQVLAPNGAIRHNWSVSDSIHEHLFFITTTTPNAVSITEHWIWQGGRLSTLCCRLRA